jgi:CelD/BcsL family acetyltransferase involved in cellulose biosynthesis
MISARIISPADLSPDDIACWNTVLAQRSDLSSPYLTPGFAQAVAHVRPHDSRVAIFACEGKTVGFLSYRAGKTTAAPLGAPMCDVQAVIATEPLPADAVLSALGVKRFVFDNALAQDPTFAPGIRTPRSAHVLDLSGGYDAYLAQRAGAGSKIAQRVAKKMRKAEREAGPLRLTLSTDAADFNTLLAWKQAQYRATNVTDIFRYPWTTALLHHLFAVQTPGFSGQFYTLHIGDTLAAAAFNLATPHTLHAWFVAYDPALSAHSPGQMLFLMMAEDAAMRGIATFDLGTGDYRFKTELATGTLEMGDGVIGAPGAIRSLSPLAQLVPVTRVRQLPDKVARRIDLYAALHD